MPTLLELVLVTEFGHCSHVQNLVTLVGTIAMDVPEEGGQQVDGVSKVLLLILMIDGVKVDN